MKVILVLFFATFSFAQTSVFRDPSCNVAITKKTAQQYPVLVEAIQNIFADKDFQTYTLQEDQRVPIGSLHLSFQKRMVGKGLYPACVVNLKIKRAEHTYLSKSDKTIFDLKAKRNFPRLTFEGISRCKRALRDASYSLPHCLGPQ